MDGLQEVFIHVDPLYFRFKKGAMPKSMRCASALEKRIKERDEQRKARRKKVYELLRNGDTVAAFMRETGLTRGTADRPSE